MAKIVWDKVSERIYETGVENGVLYVISDGGYGAGVPWNGLINVSEKPTGAEPNPLYADNRKYLNLISKEELEATIEAYTYPEEFEVCDGLGELEDGVLIGQQARREFGFAYKTVKGNDVDGNKYGYKLHIVYGALAKPSEKGYGTINDKPEAMTFSWDVTTTPVEVVIDGKTYSTANLVIDSTKVDSEKLATLEGILFGTTNSDPRLPLPDEITTLFASAPPSAVALSTIVPADGEPAAAINSDIVITFNNAISKGVIIVATADGDIVEGAESWDATAKMYTFNPTENLATDTDYVVTIGGVVDVYGQALVSTVKNFTTTS